jgi:hypothetical protein
MSIYPAVFCATCDWYRSTPTAGPRCLHPHALGWRKTPLGLVRAREAPEVRNAANDCTDFVSCPLWLSLWRIWREPLGVVLLLWGLLAVFLRYQP